MSEAIELTKRLRLPYLRKAMADVVPTAKAQRWDPAEVVRHGKGTKVRIYRFARRSGYRRHAGHRQPFTEVKIADVMVG